MKLFQRLSIGVAVTVAAGCASGPVLSDYPSAHGPEGATVRITVGNVAYRAELLETRADSFLILSSSRQESSSGEQRDRAETRVRLVSFESISSVELSRGGAFVDKVSPKASPATHERLRLLSRYPQGLSPELMQQLLKMYGQTDVERGK
jgi:hypothetical protein